MKRPPAHACTRPTTGPAACTATCRSRCRATSSRVFCSKRKARQRNRDREGSLLDFLEAFTGRFPGCVDEYETLLTDNRIWKQRTVDIGVVSPERALQLGFTGPMLRGSGISGTCAAGSRMRCTTRCGSTCRSAPTATVTTVTWCGSRKCASRTGSSANAWNGCARIRDQSSLPTTRSRRRRVKR